MRHTTARICAALFALALLAFGIASNLHPWRRLQVEFYTLELEQAEARITVAQERQAPQLEAMRDAVETQRRRLTEQEPETTRLEEGLRTLRRKEERARIRLEDARYALTTARRERTAVENLNTELREARREVEAWQEEIAEQELALRKLGTALATAEAQEESFRAGLRTLEDRAVELQQGASRRAWPLLGLFDPMVATQEVTLLDLPRTTPHAGAPRVDRCITCHLGAERPGFEEFPAPFSSHPRLDLFVGEGSAHPYAEVGCTICHGGEGRATAFDRAGHLPRDAEQEKTWQRQWGFRRERLPAQPIQPQALVEAGCEACHQSRGDLSAAPTLETGRRLGLRLGCGACHPALAEEPGMPKRGPSLLGLAARTRPSWVARFLEAPRAFRSTTWMPHGFHLKGASEDEERRQKAEIQAIVAYLWEHSSGARLDSPPEGDPEVGRILFGRVGCTACHVLDPTATRDTYAPGFERLQGPNLARMGDKVEAGWLFAWLRDPKAHRPDTPMPNLRLQENEAAAITAFLMAQKDPAWQSTWQTRELPPSDPVTRDGLVLEHLEQALTLRQSAAQFEAMEERERTLYLGERALVRHGCHGCHDLPGFETTPPPTVPLPTLKPQTVMAWKHDAPSSEFYDPAWHNTPQREAMMVNAPRYDLSTDERTALATWLLAVQMPKAPAGFSPTDPDLAAGQRLLDRYGCRGCHAIEGRGGLPEPGERPRPTPPTLIDEGRRVHPSWLLAFLHDPGKYPIRPWLEMRMPGFALSDQQLETLVGYFVARDGASLFEAPPSPSSAIARAVGAVYFDLLQCTRCHYGQEDSGGLQVPQFAPDYTRAQKRLRPAWVEEWILDPTRYHPRTSMPALVADGSDATFLLRSLDAPMFTGQKARLLRVFEGEEALAAFLEDPERVAQALRAHIWSLGGKEPVR